MSMEQSGNERMASMQSMRKIWFRGRSWTSTGFDFTAGLIFSMTPTAHSSKLNETAMSQRGDKVKDVHNIRIHRESRDQGHLGGTKGVRHKIWSLAIPKGLNR
jgi:hypothetical protein